MEQGMQLGPENTFRAECGWFCLKPKRMQRLMSPKLFLLFVCIGTTMQGFILNGLINVNITTLERRFSLSSSQTGLIAGMYDISATFFSIPIAYIGGRAAASKPRWIGAGLVVMGTGAFVFSLPHFLTDRYTSDNYDNTALCTVSSTTNTSIQSSRYADCSDTPTSKEQHFAAEDASSLSRYLYVFLFAQIMHGIGAAPLWSLAVAFIEANVEKTLVSVYLGIYYTSALIGPAFGFAGGSLLLNVYTELGAFDPQDEMYQHLTPRSSQWVGAWWMPFLLAAFVTWLAALPVLAFPARLPSSSLLKADTSEMHGRANRQQLAHDDTLLASAKIKYLPSAIWNCLTNPTFLFVSLAGGTDGAVLAGISTFMPKIMESQLSLSASQAGLYTGVAALLGGATGTMTGGFLVRRLQMTVVGMVRMVAVFSAVSLALSLMFLFSCSNVRMAGVNVSYPASSTSIPGLALLKNNISLASTCNNQCECHRSQYAPVCAPDGTSYFSPCYAGCTQESPSGFSSCTCYHGNASTPSSSVLVRGACSTACGFLPLLVVLLTATAFSIFIGSAPSSTSIVRSVSPQQRSLAMGISMTLLRVVGTIPGPVVFGRLIDKSCVLWSLPESCNEIGSCRLYDNWWMSRYVLVATLTWKTLSFIFYNLAWLLYKPQDDVDMPVFNANTEADKARDRREPCQRGTENSAFEIELT